MSRFTPAQRAAVIAESRRLLAEDAPARSPPPSPSPQRALPVNIVFEDAVAKWKREADEADRERARAKAEIRREERADRRAFFHRQQTAVDIEQRVAALEARMDNMEAAIATLAEGMNGAATFSGNAAARFSDVETAFKALNTELDTMRAQHQSEYSALRDRVSGKETTAARERAERAEAANDARHNAAERIASREHGKTRQQLANLHEDVVNVARLVVKNSH
jgi:hypothetical protein